MELHTYDTIGSRPGEIFRGRRWPTRSCLVKYDGVTYRTGNSFLLHTLSNKLYPKLFNK